MARLLLNTIALDPHRWTADKVPRFGLGTLLGPIAEAGFRGLEVWPFHVVPEPDAVLHRLRRRAAGLGLEVVIVGMYPQLHHEGAARQRAWDAAVRVLDAAALLGAVAVKLFVGNLASAALSAAASARSLTFLAALANAARARGLRLTGETHPDTLFDTRAACRRVLDALPADALQVCFQPFDFADTQRALADYAALAPHVAHVHLQGRRGGRLALLQDADLDYDALLGALAAHRFAGWLSIEFVAGCVVEDPAAFDLAGVLRTAGQDRAFVQATAQAHGLALAC